MKRKSNNQLRKIAKEILSLEQCISLDKNDKVAQEKIENIMCSLSWEEVMWLDDYIYDLSKKTKNS